MGTLRLFLAPRLGVALVIGLLLSGALTAAPTQKPNFLIVISDDQRYDAMGVVQREQKEKYGCDEINRLASHASLFSGTAVPHSGHTPLVLPVKL